jgi:hypothetical protein
MYVSMLSNLQSENSSVPLNTELRAHKKEREREMREGELIN